MSVVGSGGLRERERVGRGDRRTDTQERERGRQTDREGERQTDRERERDRGRERNRETDRRQVERHTDADGQTRETYK